MQRFIFCNHRLLTGCFILLLTWGPIIRAFGADLVIDRLSVREGVEIQELKDNQQLINIVRADHGVSHNIFDRFVLDEEGIVINNSDTRILDTAGLGVLGANKNLNNPAKTIIIEVVGHKRAEFKGSIRVVGEKAKLVLVNPDGIDCSNCNFINVTDVELRTGSIYTSANGEIKWDRELKGEVRVRDGMVVKDASLLLDAKKIKLDGGVDVDGELKLLAHSWYGNSLDQSDEGKTRGYTIEINLSDRIQADKIELTTKDGGVKIFCESDKGGQVFSRGDFNLNSIGNLNLANQVVAKKNINIVANNIVIAKPGDGGVSSKDYVAIESGGVLEIKGSNMEFKEGVELKNGAGLLKITGNKVTGAADLNSNRSIEILSYGNASFGTLIFNGKVSLVAKGDIVVDKIINHGTGDMKIFGRKIDLNMAEGADRLFLYGKEISGDLKLSKVNNLEIIDNQGKKGSKGAQNFNLNYPLTVDGEFKFVGKDFNNNNLFKAGNISLDLSGSFVNNDGGDITTDNFRLNGKDFINYQTIHVGNGFYVKGDTFINDKNGDISAGPIDIYLTGKLADGNAFVQRSDAVLESKAGGIDLIAPSGGIYFGYKRQPNGKGDNGSGFDLIGSKLFSHGGDIHIQSGGDMMFEGVETLGKIIAESKGNIAAKNVTASYRDGTKKVYSHTDDWCRCFGLFGGCVCGWGHEDIYKDAPNDIDVNLESKVKDEEFFAHKDDLSFLANKNLADTGGGVSDLEDGIEQLQNQLSVNKHKQAEHSSSVNGYIKGEL